MVLPILFAGQGGEWAGVRNYQIAVTVVAIALALRSKAKAVSPVSTTTLRVCFSLFGLAMLASSLTRYLAFETSAFNFSIFDLMLWNTWQGRFMETPVCDCNHFAVHLHLILIAILPLFKVFSTHYLLLMLQPTAIFFAGIVFYRLVTRRTQNSGFGLLAVTMFYSHPLTGSILGYQFHPEVFYLLFGFLLIDAWDQDKTILWIAASIAIWTVKEEAGIYTAFFALSHLFGDKDRRVHATILFVSSIVVFAFMNGYALPRVKAEFGDILNYNSYWSRYGDTVPAIAIYLLTHPWVAIWPIATSSWYKILGAALFVPLLNWRAFLPAIAGIAILGLSSKPSMRQYSFYHSASFLAYLCWAHVSGTIAPTLVRLRHYTMPLGILGMLSMPMWGSGYLRYFGIDWELRKDFSALAMDMGGSATICLQDPFWPHAPYDWNLKSLNHECMKEPGAIGIAHPELKAYPMHKSELREFIEGYESEVSDSGLTILRPSP